MNSRTSLYLDALRAGAALMVFFSHVRFDWFSLGQGWIPDLGHEMVIVFFVLSGFVIAHTHAKRPADWRRFATDRLSRIYSVAIPALLLTALLDQVGSRLAPALYAEQLPPGSYFARMLLGAAFLNQTWGLSSRTGSNGPYWSLSYEFWYYALFACWVFVRPFGRRLVLVGICVLFAGPKILMLMPVWLCGVAAYVASARRVFPPRIALPVVIATGLMIAFVFHESESWTAVPPLYFSGRAAQDLWLGLLVAINILAVDAGCRTRAPIPESCWPPKVVRFWANRSFSLYLFHLPLMLFACAIVPYDRSSASQVILMAIGTLLGVGILSGYTEMRRDPWRRVIGGFLGVAVGDRARAPVGTK